MALIGVDETFFFIILYGFVGVALALLGVVFSWIIVWFKYVPRAARQLSKAAHRHYPLNMVFFDEGYVEMNASSKFTEEILLNPDGSFGALPSRPTISTKSIDDYITMVLSSLPQNTLKELASKKLLNPDCTGTIEQVKTLETLGIVPTGTAMELEALPNVDEQARTQTTLNDIGTQPFIERSLGVPVLLQYAPKGIVLNAKTLALIQHGKKIGGLPLNPLLVKQYFGRMWVTNRIKGIAKMSELKGMEKAKSFIGKWEKWMPLFIIIALTALVLGLAVALAYS